MTSNTQLADGLERLANDNHFEFDDGERAILGRAIETLRNPAPLPAEVGDSLSTWASVVREAEKPWSEELAATLDQAATQLAAAEAKAQEVAGEIEGLRNERARATRALMDFTIHRYLMSNVRNDGAEKATRHNELVEQFLTVFAPNKRRNIEMKRRVHDSTQELTNHLDRIGLGDDCHYEDSVVQTFHDRFIELARLALKDKDNGK